MDAESAHSGAFRGRRAAAGCSRDSERELARHDAFGDGGQRDGGAVVGAGAVGAAVEGEEACALADGWGGDEAAAEWETQPQAEPLVPAAWEEFKAANPAQAQMLEANPAAVNEVLQQHPE